MILLLAALSCSPPVMQNVSKYPWNDYDKKEMKMAEKRCGELYSDAPCLKLWRKFGDRMYTAICAQEKK